MTHPGTPRAGRLLGQGRNQGLAEGSWGPPCLPQTLRPRVPRGTSPCAEVQAAPESIAWLSPSLSGAPRRRAATACSNQQIRQTCVRKSLICAFAIAFIISVMLIAANQVLRSGMK